MTLVNNNLNLVNKMLSSNLSSCAPFIFLYYFFFVKLKTSQNSYGKQKQHNLQLYNHMLKQVLINLCPLITAADLSSYFCFVFNKKKVLPAHNEFITCSIWAKASGVVRPHRWDNSGRDACHGWIPGFRTNAGQPCWWSLFPEPPHHIHQQSWHGWPW